MATSHNTKDSLNKSTYTFYLRLLLLIFQTSKSNKWTLNHSIKITHEILNFFTLTRMHCIFVQLCFLYIVNLSTWQARYWLSGKGCHCRGKVGPAEVLLVANVANGGRPCHEMWTQSWFLYRFEMLDLCIAVPNTHWKFWNTTYNDVSLSFTIFWQVSQSQMIRWKMLLKGM